MHIVKTSNVVLVGKSHKDIYGRGNYVRIGVLKNSMYVNGHERKILPRKPHGDYTLRELEGLLTEMESGIYG